MELKLLKNKKHFHKEVLKYAAFFFAFVVLYNFLVINKCRLWTCSQMSYVFHTVDYSFGFVSRTFAGAFYHLFFKEVIPWQLNVYLTVLMLLLFAVVRIMLAWVLHLQQDKKVRRLFLILCLFFLSGPSTFAGFTFTLGYFDFYFLFAAVLCFFCIENKYLRFLIPAIMVCAVLVNYAFIITYFLLIAIILLDKCLCAEGSRWIWWVILSASLVAVIGMVIYLLIFEKSNLTVTYEEFNRIMEKRMLYPDSKDYIGFYNHYYFGKYSFGDVTLSDFTDKTYFLANSTIIPATIVRALNYVYGSILCILTVYEIDFYPLVHLSILLLPFLVLFYRYWVLKFKEAKKAEKLVYLAAMIQPFVTILGVLFSTDIPRFMTNLFCIQFAMFIYFMYSKKELNFLKNSLFLSKQNSLLIIYYLIYASTFYITYA